MKLMVESAVVEKVSGGFHVTPILKMLSNGEHEMAGGPIECAMARPNGSDATVVLRVVGGPRTVHIGTRTGQSFITDTSLTADGATLMLKRPGVGVLGIRDKVGARYNADIISLVDVPEARRRR